MTEISYSLLLRNLSDDHFHQRVTFEEYRVLRKKILDTIDVEFNGLRQPAEPVQVFDPGIEEEPTQDFLQTIAFNSNINLDA